MKRSRGAQAPPPPAEEGSLLLVGVGGQGVVLASAIIADVALLAGYDVKQSEVHGMSQRGGVVSSHLRFGREVHSPLVEPGQADVLIAFEWNEALRWLSYLRPGAPLIVNVQRLVPPNACRDRKGGHSGYPSVQLGALADVVGDVRACDASEIAANAGSAKALNSVLLGVLAPMLLFPEWAWAESLERHVPRGSYPINERAFLAGRALDFPAETRRLATDGLSSNGHHADARVRAPKLEIIPSWCKGEVCGICVRMCPEDCLAFDHTEKVVAVREDACTACRLCELLCPDFAIVVHDAWRAAEPTTPIAGGGHRGV